MSTDPKPAARPNQPGTGAIGKPAAAGLAKPGAEQLGITQEGAKPPPLAGASGPVAFEFEESTEPAPKKSYAPPAPAPAEPSPAGGAQGARGRAPAPAPSTAVADDVDPDVKPGSRKDLWNCPHCGAGNKPGRPSCRTCGKSPDDPVVKPWFKNPLLLGGVIGGVVVLVVLLNLLMGGTNLSLKPADAAHLDQAIRHGKHGSEHTLEGGATFSGEHRFAVCGRCIGTSPNTAVPGALDCVLLLGADAADENTNANATFPTGAPPQVSGASTYVVLHLVPNGSVKLTLAKGTIVSLTGEEGHIDGITAGNNEYVVLVDALQP